VRSRSAEPHLNERQRRGASVSIARSPGRGGGQAWLFGTAEARRLGCTNQRNLSTGSVPRRAKEGTSIGVPKTVIGVDIGCVADCVETTGHDADHTKKVSDTNVVIELHR
jgi:hypothetical protein